MHPEPGACPVGDVYGIYPAALEAPGGLDYGLDVVTPRKVDLHRDGEARLELLGEARHRLVGDPWSHLLLRDVYPPAGNPPLGLEVPQHLRESVDVSGGCAAAAPYEARPRLGELDAVGGEVPHVPVVAD